MRAEVGEVGKGSKNVGGKRKKKRRQRKKLFPKRVFVLDSKK